MTCLVEWRQRVIDFTKLLIFTLAWTSGLWSPGMYSGNTHNEMLVEALRTELSTTNTLPPAVTSAEAIYHMRHLGRDCISLINDSDLVDQDTGRIHSPYTVSGWGFPCGTSCLSTVKMAVPVTGTLHIVLFTSYTKTEASHKIPCFTMSPLLLPKRGWNNNWDLIS